MRLEGRVALVTGGARRVGAAIVRRLAANGMRVAIHCNQSRDAADELCEQLNSAGVMARVVICDLDDSLATSRLAGEVVSTFGRLDVLINNASIFESMKIEDFTIDAWERTLRINLTAPMILTHAAATELRRNAGRVINLLDAACDRPWPTHLAYCVSKGALQTLTRALARALAPEVNVVGLAPGVADWPDDYGPELRAKLTNKIPLKRAGSPEDIAAAVHFLLSEGDYISGVTLPIDGGRSIA